MFEFFCIVGGVGGCGDIGEVMEGEGSWDVVDLDFCVSYMNCGWCVVSEFRGI